MVGLLVIAGLGIIGALVYIGLREDRGRDPLQERLAQYGEREIPDSLEDIELSLSFRDRILVPTLRRIADLTARFTPQKQLEQTRRLLELAGMTTDPTMFFAMRVVLTLGFVLGSIMLFFVLSPQPFMNALGYTVAAAGLGYILPVMSVRSRIRRRQDSVIKALPDALDLLVICVEAGLGFDAALGKVYEKWDNELAISFGRVLREIQLGKLRREALRDMALRLDVPDVNAFVAAIVQADQLGVSMAKILRVQSDQMRTKRRQRAQEKAHQAPVKMMIPMVLLIFPSIWIVLLGPAVIQVMSVSGNGAF
ncbi:MAG: type II secretion system F family protein [Chloroflexi bacterium]|nr:type II secretion system F family protein [Chloroflexota bacterium]